MSSSHIATGSSQQQQFEHKVLEVEVYYQADENAWLDCEIKDLITEHSSSTHAAPQKLFKVKLLNKHLRDKDLVVPNLCLRYKRVDSQSYEDHKYSKGDTVEVYSKSTLKDESSHLNDIYGWRKGMISNIKGNYVSIEFDQQLHPDQSAQLYSVSQIRPYVEQHSPNPDHIHKSEVTLSPDIQNWVNQLFSHEYEHEKQSFFDQLAYIQKVSQVYGITISNEGNKLIILGPQEKLKKASLQADIFLNSQRQIMEMDKQLKFKNKQPSAAANQFEKETFVDSSLIGLIIGQGGSQIKKISDQFNVQIVIEKQNPHSSTGDSKRKITITGKNEKDVNEAIEYVTLQRINIPIEHDLIDYVCGHNDNNLGYFHEKSDVISLNVERGKDDKYQLIAIGRVSALEDLKDIVETHISYYESYQKKESQRKELTQKEYSQKQYVPAQKQPKHYEEESGSGRRQNEGGQYYQKRGGGNNYRGGNNDYYDSKPVYQRKY